MMQCGKHENQHHPSHQPMENIIPLLVQLLESLHAGTFFIGLVYGTCSTGQQSVSCSCEHGTV